MSVYSHESCWMWLRRAVLFRNLDLVAVVAFLMIVGSGSAFTALPALVVGDRAQPSFAFGRLHSMKSNQEVKTVVNGEESGAGGLLRMQDTKSQLFAAFTTLGEGDQYDAVLTGLCAKILENTSLSSQEVQDALQDPLQLLEEMNRRRIRASPRSLMALIDVSTDTYDSDGSGLIWLIHFSLSGLDLLFVWTHDSPLYGRKVLPIWQTFLNSARRMAA